MYKLDGRWCANAQEFEKDVEKKYDWVYVVDSMGYTKFDKTEKIKEQMTNITPYEALFGVRLVEVIGTMQRPFEDFERMIMVDDGVIYYGVHPSVVKKL